MSLSRDNNLLWRAQSVFFITCGTFALDRGEKLSKLSELTGNAWTQRHQIGWVDISVCFSYRNRSWGYPKERGRNWNYHKFLCVAFLIMNLQWLSPVGSQPYLNLSEDSYLSTVYYSQALLANTSSFIPSSYSTVCSPTLLWIHPQPLCPHRSSSRFCQNTNLHCINVCTNSTDVNYHTRATVSWNAVFTDCFSSHLNTHALSSGWLFKSLTQIYRSKP